jgi:hypothetical protein
MQYTYFNNRIVHAQIAHNVYQRQFESLLYSSNLYQSSFEVSGSEFKKYIHSICTVDKKILTPVY